MARSHLCYTLNISRGRYISSPWKRKRHLEVEIQHSRCTTEAASLRTSGFQSVCVWKGRRGWGKGKRICRWIEPSLFRALDCDWYWEKKKKANMNRGDLVALYLPYEILCPVDNLGPQCSSGSLKPRHNKWRVIVFGLEKQRSWGQPVFRKRNNFWLQEVYKLLESGRSPEGLLN